MSVRCAKSYIAVANNANGTGTCKDLLVNLVVMCMLVGN